MQTYRELADDLLLQSVLQKDENAWNELMRRYRGLIFRCIIKVTGRYESILASEDVTEIFGDVFLNLVRNDMHKLRAYDKDRGMKLGSWLGLISIHTAYDYLRAHRRRPMLDRLDKTIERPSEGPNPEEQALQRERFRRLGDLLGAFSERDRTFFELYYGRGLAPEAIADAMQISVKTVYSKKNKIRNKLERLSKAARAGELPLAA